MDVRKRHHSQSQQKKPTPLTPPSSPPRSRAVSPTPSSSSSSSSSSRPSHPSRPSSPSTHGNMPSALRPSLPFDRPVSHSNPTVGSIPADVKTLTYTQSLIETPWQTDNKYVRTGYRRRMNGSRMAVNSVFGGCESGLFVGVSYVQGFLGKPGSILTTAKFSQIGIMR